MAKREIEWLGGRYTLPQEVRDGASVFHPEVCLWIELPRGSVVGTSLSMSGTEHPSLADSLDTALHNPLDGAPRRPTRLRVADPRAADEISEVAEGLPIVVAPVPELDEVFAALADEFSGPPGYLADDIPPQVLEEFFNAARLLFRSAPWHRMSEEQILRVDIPAYAIDGACLSVVGAAGESRGLLLFDSLAAYHAFARLAASNGKKKPARSDGRLIVRALSFDRREDVPESILRDIEEHRWPVAGNDAYPVPTCVSADAEPLPFIEEDVRILTVVARAFVAFFLRHADVFGMDDPEPVRESSESDDGVRVTLTAPYVVSEETSRPARNVGRNDPCPCGSGKKYKKCHLDADQAQRREAAAVESIHAMDARLVRALNRLVVSRTGADCFGVEYEDEDEDAFLLLLPWLTWTAEIDGRRAADLYLEQHRHHLSDEEREWIAAQQAAWLSVWEIVAVGPGRVEARDLLTGETRVVREERGSQGLVVRDALLARMIDYRGMSYFGGMHSRPLPPMAASAVVDAVRTELGLHEAPVPIARLRDRKIGWDLIDAWTEAVEGASLPPALQNTDGDPLQFVTDSYAFSPETRAEIERRLEAMHDFESADAGEGDERVYVFVRRSDDTVIGNVRVVGAMLHVETNSRNRADALSQRVEEACAGILVKVDRLVEKVPRPSPGSEPDEPLPETPPEEQELLRRVKEEHYRRWLDTPLPALGGKTPRAASRSKKLRPELDLVLRTIEHAENHLPDAERFDVEHLRRELFG